MNIFDFIITVDKKNRIKKVEYYGQDRNWFDKINWHLYMDKNLETVLGLNIEERIIEFHNKFYCCHKIIGEVDTRYYFSSQMYMKKLYEESIDKVSEGIQIFDRNGYFIHANRSSEELEGYNKSDYLGKHLLDIYNLTEEYSTTLTALRTKKPVKNRCDRFTGKDNKELVTINSSYPLNSNGILLGAVTFEGDLTLIKDMKHKSFNLEEFIKDDRAEIDQVRYKFDDIIHESDVMIEAIAFGKKIARSNANILIIGDTGTGKELFAQSIHNHSYRRHKPFIDLNCSAVPENLAESIFFGTHKGAFTGSQTKKGLIELSDGGTLFLDEINSMSLEIQAKLLRAIEEKRFRKVGGEAYISCDIRIIAASNINLREHVETEHFRKDFYYRVSGLTLDIPPLKDRGYDVIILSEYILQKLGTEYCKRYIQVSDTFKNELLKYDWPGNVRELKHVLEYAINRMQNDEQILEISHLPDYLLSKISVQINVALKDEVKKQAYTAVNLVVEEVETRTLKEQVGQVEKKIIISTLSQHYGNITRAATSLGISRQSLQYRLKKYGV